MRIVYKKFVSVSGGDVNDVIVRTDDDGSNPEVIEGTQPPRSDVLRVPIVIEVSCDDDNAVISDARNALQRIGDFLQK